MVDISFLLAPCGLYCGWCPYYIRGTEEFKCPGCWKREDKCAIRDYARDRGLKLCSYCSLFPCDKLSRMYARMDEFFKEIRRDFPEGIKSET